MKTLNVFLFDGWSDASTHTSFFVLLARLVHVGLSHPVQNRAYMNLHRNGRKLRVTNNMFNGISRELRCSITNTSCVFTWNSTKSSVLTSHKLYKVKHDRMVTTVLLILKKSETFGVKIINSSNNNNRRNTNITIELSPSFLALQKNKYPLKERLYAKQLEEKSIRPIKRQKGLLSLYNHFSYYHSFLLLLKVKGRFHSSRSSQRSLINCHLSIHWRGFNRTTFLKPASLSQFRMLILIIRRKIQKKKRYMNHL